MHVWRERPVFRILLRCKTCALLRCKTCALLKGNTCALLRGKTCALLRAKTCALLTANIKESTKGGGRPKAARPPLWRRPKAAFSSVGFPMGTGLCMWAAWASFPHLYCANVPFCLWVSPWLWARTHLTPAWHFHFNNTQHT